MTYPTTTQSPSEETGVTAAIHQVPAEAAEVASEVAQQARDLMGEARTQLRQQVDDQTTVVVDALRRTSLQLETMASANPQPDSPAAELVRQLGQVGERVSTRLEDGGVDGVVDDVTRFARQHTGAFLGLAFGVGLLSGRFLRSDIEQRRDDSPESAAGSGTEADIDLRNGSIVTPPIDVPPATYASSSAPSDAFPTGGIG